MSLRKFAARLVVIGAILLAPNAAYSGDGAADYDPTAPRRIAITLRDYRGVAGFLATGDRVDIMLNREPSGAPPKSEVLVENARVVAAIHSVEEPPGYQAVWLDLDENDARKVRGAFGHVWLARRNQE
jgi:Flp pilus assembly protein CpaB